ncbi:hypothetical protein A2673_00200 [Candidatus Kaiserbacteria bacterium RIFCSPHIGHO2_01_FULL_50_13]|nr:MAG: hypothetical protein A2673_00200 [Candidatus Kaiserbacteria bacterium RIFCSPHIGHO2_01_FULL_50_13]
MKLTAQAGENRTVTIGTDVPFIGLAHDDKKKPMENVHYTWNFGDGTTAEGKEVTHRFLYSGRYAVVLKVFHYGAYATHRITVVAEEVELTLALSEDGGVVLSNKGRRNADISLWRVVMDFHTFTLPEHTVILPGATLRLSPTLLRFHAAAKAELQFPSGAVAVRVKEVEKTEPPKTAHTAIEPFVSETKAPSSRVSLTPSVSVHTSESEVETNTEFEAESVATTTQLAAASTADTRVSYAWWLGAALISLLGAGAVYAIRRKQKDDWKIIDESAG